MSADAQQIHAENQRYPPSRVAGLNPPYPPGTSGNPGGVRKGQVYVGERIKYLITLSPEEFDSFVPATVADEIAYARVKNARSDKRKGLAEAQMVADRTEGKAPQKLDISGEITVNHVEQMIVLHAQINALAERESLSVVELFALPSGEFAERVRAGETEAGEPG